MSHPENPAMNGHKGTGLEPGLDLLWGHAGANELSPRDDAVGPTGQLGDLSLDRADLWLHNNH
jgi:hypothetical protein